MSVSTLSGGGPVSDWQSFSESCFTKLTQFIMDFFQWLSFGVCCRRFETQWEQVQTAPTCCVMDRVQSYRREMQWEDPAMRLHNFIRLRGILRLSADASCSEDALRDVVTDIFCRHMPEEILREVAMNIHCRETPEGTTTEFSRRIITASVTSSEWDREGFVRHARSSELLQEVEDAIAATRRGERI